MTLEEEYKALADAHCMALKTIEGMERLVARYQREQHGREEEHAKRRKRIVECSDRRVANLKLQITKLEAACLLSVERELGALC